VAAMQASEILNKRHNINVLVISASGTTSNQIRGALKNIGFNKLSAIASHVGGLERMKGRNFEIVFFDAKSTDMPTIEFVKGAVNLRDNAILIAMSGEPRIDDVFGMLRAGARGFVVMPFTIKIVEDVIMKAFEGSPFSEAVLNAVDRNAALCGVVLNNLYRLSVMLRQAREFPSAAKDVDRYRVAFAESMELARMFCEGADDDVLRDRIIDDCIARANIAATRLGRTRKKLKEKRAKSDDEDDDDTAQAAAS
jgi:DNA-binding response OmpR family regulator